MKQNRTATVTANFRLPPEYAEKLALLAKAYGMSRAHLVRMWIEDNFDCAVQDGDVKKLRKTS